MANGSTNASGPSGAYTPQELMVVCAARAIRDGEVVFVGMRLPLIAFALAKRTHAPDAIGLFENGLVRDTPSRELLLTMGDAPNILGAEWASRTGALMGLLAQGWANLGFVGAAEVDRYGNLNTSYIGDRAHPQVKLPGSGGGADIASLAQRLAIIMSHERKRFPERVSYITSPGWGDGGAWRERVGLPRGGPSAVITTLAVLGFTSETHEMELQSWHPGSSADEVRAQTGWDLRITPDAHETLPPTADELRLIREIDPEGFWTR
ncbi:MAG TPA: CoA-transferase [Ktedonobacterales bacterium]|jgi:glutaconate CoA-transferase subunit B|nr:CoA-transferase [Ktedonobacterales bacterium]